MLPAYKLIRWIIRNVVLSDCKNDRFKRVIVRDDLNSVWLNLTVQEIVEYRDISKSLCKETCKFAYKNVLYIARDLIGRILVRLILW